MALEIVFKNIGNQNVNVFVGLILIISNLIRVFI